MKKIIYILGLSHSGSTLIEYYLSSFEKSIGIGEAYKTMHAFQDGNFNRFSEFDRDRIKNISFWQKMADSAKEYKNAKEHYIAMYDYILNSEEFSKYDLIIDSSKKLEGYKILSENFGDQVTAIVLYRDLRAWIISSIETEKRKKRPNGFGSNFKYCFIWYKTHFFINRYLKKSNSKSFKLSYDLFCLDFENVNEYIKNKLDLNSNPDLKKTNSINILGNRMKKKAEVKLDIKYDYRWMYKSEWHLPWFLVPVIKKVNKENVWKTFS